MHVLEAIFIHSFISNTEAVNPIEYICHLEVFISALMMIIMQVPTASL